MKWEKILQNRLKVGGARLKTFTKSYTSGRKVLFLLEIGVKQV